MHRGELVSRDSMAIAIDRLGSLARYLQAAINGASSKANHQPPGPLRTETTAAASA
jgi:hypothetical protein